MKSIQLPIVLCAVLFSVIACSSKSPMPMDMSTAVKSASSKADHLTLAKHYEEAAAAAQAQVADHQKLLVQYKEKSFLYGKEIYDFEEHCDALIRIYQQAAKANLKMAEMHRQLAQSAP